MKKHLAELELADVLGLAGFASLVFGVGMIYRAAAPILAGVLLMAFAYFISGPRK